MSLGTASNRFTKKEELTHCCLKTATQHILYPSPISSSSSSSSSFSKALLISGKFVGLKFSFRKSGNEVEEKMTDWRIRLLVIVIASLCVTCGGSGGGSSSTFAPSYTPPPPSYPDVRGSWVGTHIRSIIWSTGASLHTSDTSLWVINQTGNQLSGTIQAENDDTGLSNNWSHSGSITTSGNLTINFHSFAYTSTTRSCTLQTGNASYTGSFSSGIVTISNSRTDLCTDGSGLYYTESLTQTMTLQKP